MTIKASSLRALFNFNFDAYFTGAIPFVHEKNRWVKFSEFLVRKLDKAAGFLETNDLVFEAGEAREIMRLFNNFADKEDSTPEEFLVIWEEFTDWADQSVYVSGREKVLVDVPNLPRKYTW